MLNSISKHLPKFTKFEISLWVTSVLVVLVSSIFGESFDLLSLIASLIGVTSLIFYARGHIAGQILMIIFCLIYGYISYKYAYYGEMITYLGMTLPVTVIAMIEWLKNPFKGNNSEVEVANIEKKQVFWLFLFTAIVTLIFYFILKYFNTARLTLSTISIATSFFAMYLTYLRSPLYAIAYSLNDIVLMGLWIFASLENSSYITMVMCFFMFLLNDLYGYYSWKKMKKRQQAILKQKTEM